MKLNINNENISIIDKFTCISPTNAGYTRFLEIPKYKEGLYDLNNDVYAWMVPNGSWGESNAGLIVGKNQSLLVDTLWDFKYTKAMLEAMQHLTNNKPIKYVVNTHPDGDHFWGNALINKAKIIASKNARSQMRKIKPKSMIMLGKVGKLLTSLKLESTYKVGNWFQNMVSPYNFKEVKLKLANRTFKDKMIVKVGGRKVELIEIKSAHTKSDTMVYLPDSKTLFSGDILFIGSTPATWSGPIENWLKALDLILNMDVETIIPGHGPITDKNGVKQVKNYWQYISTNIRRCYKSGMSAEKAAYDIVLSKEFEKTPYAKWNSPERIMTNVHIIYRHLKGKTKAPKMPELINIMRKQALLAYELPNAQPAIMRQKRNIF